MYPHGSYRWFVLAIFMYLTILTRISWLTFASITTYMETRLGLPASTIVWLSLVFIIALLVLAIPAGIIIDKKGFRSSVGFGAILLGIFRPFACLRQIHLACSFSHNAGPHLPHRLLLTASPNWSSLGFRLKKKEPLWAQLTFNFSWYYAGNGHDAMACGAHQL